MFPKAYVISGFLQDDWRIRNNLTLNLGLRYDVEIIKDIPDWPAPTDKDNLDPRVGFAWDVKGDQKWAVRGGFGRFTQQHPIFTIVKGGVGGRNGLVTADAEPGRSAVPDVPEHAAGLPAGSGAAGARHPGDLARPRERAGVDGQRRRPAPDWRARQRRRSTSTSTAASSTASSNVNQATPIPKSILAAANGTTVLRTGAQADLTRPIQPGAERLPTHRYPHERRPLLVRGRALLGAATHRLAAAPRVVHAVERRGSAEPLVLAGRQFGSRARSRPDRRRYAAQPRDQPHVDGAGQRPDLQRLAAEHGVALAERHAVLDPVRHATSAAPATCRATATHAAARRVRPGARNTERGEFINYIDLSLARTFTIGEDRIEFRADVFNFTNNPNLTADGYVGTVGNALFGQHLGGSSVFPNRQFQFAATYRF